MVLEGKLALVTGSSRGIGAAIAKRLAREGATVVVHGRDGAALATVEQEIMELGGRALAVTGDVTRFEEIEAMRCRIAGRLGSLDVLVANAGGSHTVPGPFEEITEEGWRGSLDGNLTSTFLTIKSFLPSMKERGSGSIITVSSAAGRRAGPRSPIPYAAAKAGVQMLTQDLALQLGPFGIRVNCIAPETILTERNAQWITPDQQRSLAGAHPLQRLGTPDDVAGVAAFLASDASDWLTGLVVDVSGGAVIV